MHKGSDGLGSLKTYGSRHVNERVVVDLTKEKEGDLWVVCFSYTLNNFEDLVIELSGGGSCS